MQKHGDGNHVPCPLRAHESISGATIVKEVGRDKVAFGEHACVAEEGVASVFVFGEDIAAVEGGDLDAVVQELAQVLAEAGA